MSLSKRLNQNEIESLYSGANSAIWHSHSNAAILAKKKVREEDFVATLVSDAIPKLADRWMPILQSKGIQLKVSGVFCHGHPQVEFNTPKLRVELADLLVVHQHTTSNRTTARAMLIQAKMSSNSTHKLPTSDSQLQLYSSWPSFQFVTGGLDPKIRNIRERGKGSRYALVLETQAYPEQITWADQCPWGTCNAKSVLSVDRSFAKLLGDMLLEKDGRLCNLSHPRNEWSKMIYELLTITGSKTYKRANINRGHTPRLVQRAYKMQGLMLMSMSSSFASDRQGYTKNFVSDRFFGSVPLQNLEGHDLNSFAYEEFTEHPEGGISTLIIETNDLEA